MVRQERNLIIEALDQNNVLSVQDIQKNCNERVWAASSLFHLLNKGSGYGYILKYLNYAIGYILLRSLEDEEELAQNIKSLTFEIDHAKRYLKYLDGLLASHTDELERRFNPYWGRLLKEHNDLSRFGAQVVWFACTYTSRASNFLRYSPMHRYKAARDTMSHDYVLQESYSMRQVRQSKMTSGTIPPLG